MQKEKERFFKIILILLILILLDYLILGKNSSISSLKNIFPQPVPTINPLDLEPKNASMSALSTDELKIKLPIIMFHYVEYVKDQGDHIRKSLTINPHIFETQLYILKQNDYQTYFVREIPDILDKKIDYASKSVIITFDDGYKDFYYDVFPLLKKYQMKATLYIINNFIGRNDFLTKDQIKELIKSNLVEIGAHTLNHAYLKNMDPVTAREQIFNSKYGLEKLFNIKIKTFAYPYGAFSPETLNLVKQAQFSAAVSVIPGVYASKTNILFLPRIRAGMVANENIINILENLK